MVDINKILIIVKGGGDLGSGVVHRLFRCGFPIIVVDIEKPTAVRRTVSFCEAIYSEAIQIEGITAKKVIPDSNLLKYLKKHQFVPVVVDFDGSGVIIHDLINNLKKEFIKIVLVDAIIAKHNLGTKIHDADLVIALGPGFKAGVDVHYVIETNRGQYLGQVIKQGIAQPNTGIPSSVQGHSANRVIRATRSGFFNSEIKIGESVRVGQTIGNIDGRPIIAPLDGIVRGLVKEDLRVHAGMKLGDVDPRGDEIDITIISDKARAIAGGVLEAILSFFYSA